MDSKTPLIHGNGSLSKQYDALRKSYTTIMSGLTEEGRNERKSLVHIVTDDNDTRSLSAKSILRPESPSSKLEGLDELQTNLVDEYLMHIKASGLRAIREKEIITKFHETIAAYNKRIFLLGNILDQWYSYANEVTDMAVDMTNALEKELNFAAFEKDVAERNARHATEKYDQLKIKASLLESEHKKFMEENYEEKQKIVMEKQMEMDAFTTQMQREIDLVKTGIQKESARIHEKNRTIYERKTGVEICQLKHCIKSLNNEIGIHQRQILHMERESKLEKDQHQKVLIELDEKILLLQSDLSAKVTSLKDERDEKTILEKSLVYERENHKREIIEMKELKQQELDDIEAKVKLIVKTLETKEKCAMDRALRAEQELNDNVELMSKIEEGLKQSK